MAPQRGGADVRDAASAPPPTDGSDQSTDRGGAVASIRRLGSRLALRSPLASWPTRRCYWAVGPRLARVTGACDLDEYAVPLDPFRLAWVDPAVVTRLSRRPFPPDRDARDLFGAVRGGEWDRRPIEETPVRDGHPRHLFDGPTLDRTPLASFLDDCVLGGTAPLDHPFGREVADRLVHGQHPVWAGCRDPADVHDRVRSLRERAAALLAADGDSEAADAPLTQRERALAGLEPARERDFLTARASEVLVDVARDGELLVAGGLERLCLARLLGVDRLPVAILVRHAHWAAECEWRWLEGEPLGDHPDLWDLPAARPFVLPVDAGSDPADGDRVLERDRPR